jgi:hypothetical protein
MFPSELERDAFRAGDEFGWNRAQIPLVVDILRSHQMAILGGELWWIDDRTACRYHSIPQQKGPPAVYAWVTEHHSGEAWQDFVERGASDALAAVERWPEPGDIPPDLPGRVLYNLTWVSEAEYPQ